MPSNEISEADLACKETSLTFGKKGAQEERRKRERRKHREELGKPVSRWFWFEKYAPGSLNW